MHHLKNKTVSILHTETVSLLCFISALLFLQFLNFTKLIYL